MPRVELHIVLIQCLSTQQQAAGTQVRYEAQREAYVEKIYTWSELNKKLRKLKKEADVQVLLDAERNGAKRPRWIHRIYSRYSLLRRKRERKEVIRERLRNA